MNEFPRFAPDAIACGLTDPVRIVVDKNTRWRLIDDLICALRDHRDIHGEPPEWTYGLVLLHETDDAVGAWMDRDDANLLKVGIGSLADEAREFLLGLPELPHGNRWSVEVLAGIVRLDQVKPNNFIVSTECVTFCSC